MQLSNSKQASNKSRRQQFWARYQGNALYLGCLFVSIVLALGVGAAIMAASGKNPWQGYAALVNGALGDDISRANVLHKAMQLSIAGLATAVASKAGIFNVGGEGQMHLGAMAAIYVGLMLKTVVAPWLALPLCFLAAIAAGSLYALIPALMKVKLNINEVITTIMMNTIAVTFCEFLCTSTGPLKTHDRGITKGTDKVKELLFPRLVDGSNLTEGTIYLIIIVLLVWYLMSRTTTGYAMKLTGQNQRFARFAGLKSGSLAVSGMLISGAMCGILGLVDSFSAVSGRYKPGFNKDIYFDGMLVAMIMRYNPFGTIVMCFFFAVLKVSDMAMQSYGVNSQLIQIIQSIIIFFMAAEEGLLAIIRSRRARRSAATSLRKEAEA